MTGLPPPVRVDVVIPNWNGAHLLPGCLQSLRRQTFRDFRVVVVDNGSTDGSVPLLRERFPEAVVIPLERNTGFAAACNAGIAAGRSDYVALLNNDTEAAADWLQALVAALDAGRQFGFAASKMLHFDNRSVIDRVADAFAPFGIPLAVGSGAEDGPDFTEDFECFGACGGAALYCRTMLDAIGLFPDHFFAYVEDIDLSLRAQRAGYRCLAVMGARVWHMGAASSGGGATPFGVRLTVRNTWCAMLRCLPLFLLLRMAAAAMVVQAAMVMTALLLDRGVLRRRHLPAYLAGVGAAMSKLPTLLKERRTIQRLPPDPGFESQLRMGWRQWRQHRPVPPAFYSR